MYTDNLAAYLNLHLSLHNILLIQYVKEAKSLLCNAMSLRNNIGMDKLWTLQYVRVPDRSYHSSKNILSFRFCRSTIYVTNIGYLKNLSVFYFI